MWIGIKIFGCFCIIKLMEKHFILSSFYFNLCVNKKWTRCAKFSFSKYLHSDCSELWASAWSREAVSGRHCGKNTRSLLVHVTWLLTHIGPLRYTAVWKTCFFLLTRNRPCLFFWVSSQNSWFATWDDIIFALRSLLTQHRLPESVFFSHLLVFFLPVQYTVSPPQLNPNFCGARSIEVRNPYTDCLVSQQVVDSPRPTGLRGQPGPGLSKRKPVRSPRDSDGAK